MIYLVCSLDLSRIKYYNEGIATIDLALNQASLQAGLVKFDMKPFDFKKVTAEIVEDKKGPAKVKGLKLETDIKK